MTNPDDELQKHIADLEQQLARARAKELEQLDAKHEERERLHAEFQEACIDDEIRAATAGLSRFLKAMTKVEELARRYPRHPKLAGFAGRLDTLVGGIEQFSRKVNQKRHGAE